MPNEPNNQPQITPELLRDLGDWRASKEGRSLAESGCVLGVEFNPPLLQGTVRVGGATVRARLKIAPGVFGIENLCSCRQAQRDGTICSHVVALVHAYLNRDKPRPVTPVIPAATKAEQTTKTTTVSAPLLKRVAREDAPAGSQTLELAVALPVDLAKAWRTGAMQVVVKGSVNGGQFKPLDAVPHQPAAPYIVSDADERFIAAVEKISGGVAGLWQLAANDFDLFFNSLSGHSRVTRGTQQKLDVRGGEAQPELFLDLQPSGEVKLRLAEVSMRRGEVLGAWVFDGAVLERSNPLPPAYQALAHGEVTLSREEFARFYERELPALEKHARLVLNDAFAKLQFAPRAPRIRATLEGALMGLTVQLDATYDDKAFPLRAQPGAGAEPKREWFPDASHPLRYWTRDLAAERRAQQQVFAEGFVPSERWPELYALVGENRVCHFLANDLRQWRARWDVVLGERMGNFLRRCEVIEPEVAVTSSGEDWLAVDVQFKNAAGAPALSLADVQRMLQRGVSHERLADGRIALVPTTAAEELQEVIYDCQAEQTGGALKLGRRFGAYLDEALREGPWNISSRSNWQPPPRLEAMRDLALPDRFRQLLRPYQATGVNWLHFLGENGLAGILADEMGLGKTIQTLVYLSLRKSANAERKPSLVICPTSLVTNWQAEAARFTPELRTLLLHGPKRHAAFVAIGEHDLVITSYALLRRDMEQYAALEFDTVVLDEAQHIKNRFSQNAQAAKSLQAARRFVLTGTPMENSLYDLWSIFDFLMPGYLGPATEFRDRYETPITKGGDEAALRRLRQRLRPFVLRRTKAEVARDLPAKIEQTTLCEMSDEQKSVYQAILEQSRREVFEFSGKGGEAQRRLAVLTALMRLRQACCHLDLLPATSDRRWNDPSAKLEMGLELIEEARDGGHRVLVFSQFVRLLKLIETALNERGISYCYLDGSTVDRAGVVQRFQESPEIPVFLISLKAGGTGLNLTGADTVIHFDPWWNPAVEDQATGRAHRIGQSNIVTSYKLIARGSVEEKIVLLQERKKELIASTLASDEAFAQGLTMEELQGLLE
ncbi:MAG: SNF2-related protein [Verrucomicrobia bacterium]|nr:SNF2-related protein [Verrucomicrobiota bacterium]